MTVTYIYTIGSHFPSGLNPGQLFNEIESNVNISTEVVNVFQQSNNDVDITYISSISSGEQTTTNNIIDAHAPFQEEENLTTANYITLNSSLADTSAITIDASNQSGGIDINAGTSGITIDTTNALRLTGNAASYFRTLNAGNLDISAAGVVDIEAEGGINIGANNDAQAINIGTSASSRPISIGNATGTTGITLQTGTGGFTLDTANTAPVSMDFTNANCNFTLTTIEDDRNLNIELLGATASSVHIRSEGTGVDALKFSTLNSAGGMDLDLGTTGYDLDTTGPINLASSQAAGGSITLDASSGGLTFSAGVFGVAINASGTGFVGIGHWGGGDISIGTAATARTITLGNDTTTTGLRFRHGTGARLFSQPAITSLSDANTTVTISQLKTGILSGTPTSDKTLTLPTAALSVAGLTGVAVDDALDFTVINKANTDSSFLVAMGTGGTLEGNDEVAPKENALATYKTSGSGTFRMRFTNVTASSEAYTIYRIS